jgi:hypothetical protein
MRVLTWAAASAFIIVEGSIRIFDLYRRVPWVDVPSHALSGAAVTGAILWWLRERRPTFSPRLALLGNAAVAVAWEVLELLDEVVSPDPPHLQDRFLWDGFGDVAAALAGGCLLLLAIRWRARGRLP